MKKFIALYYNHATSQHEVPDMTEAEMAAMMAPWGAWEAKYNERIVDLGAPLHPATLSQDGNSWNDSGNTVSGFSIVSAANLADAQEMFVGHPIYNHPDHTIEISEFAPM